MICDESTIMRLPTTEICSYKTRTHSPSHSDGNGSEQNMLAYYDLHTKTQRNMGHWRKIHINCLVIRDCVLMEVAHQREIHRHWRRRRRLRPYHLLYWKIERTTIIRLRWISHCRNRYRTIGIQQITSYTFIFIYVGFCCSHRCHSFIRCVLCIVPALVSYRMVHRRLHSTHPRLPLFIFKSSWIEFLDSGSGDR